VVGSAETLTTAMDPKSSPKPRPPASGTWLTSPAGRWTRTLAARTPTSTRGMTSLRALTWRELGSQDEHEQSEVGDVVGGMPGGRLPRI
jgi:hypothetical protein